MTTWTSYGLQDFSIPVSAGGPLNWGAALDGGSAVSVNASHTVATITNADGTLTEIYGTGLYPSGNGIGWTTLTGLTHLAADGTTVLDTITDIYQGSRYVFEGRQYPGPNAGNWGSPTGGSTLLLVATTGPSLTCIGSTGTDHFAHFGGEWPGYEVITCGDGNDTVWGGVGDNIITGGAGADQLHGGPYGNNTFVYNAGSEAVSGEVIDAGGGSQNTILLNNTGDIDFTGVDCSAVQTLQFGDGTSTATFRTLGFTNIVGGSGQDGVILHTAAGGFDFATNLTFSSWSTNDFVSIFVTGNSRYIDGPNVNTSFHLDAATFGTSDIWNNVINGGSGNNCFYFSGAYFQSAQVNGGSGSNTAILDFSSISGPVNFALDPAGARQLLPDGAYISGMQSIDVTLGNGGGHVTGAAGDDTFTGGSGSNTFDGGGGINTAIFSGNRADYTVTYNSGTYTFSVTDNRAGSPNGTDTLTNIEYLQFADQSDPICFMPGTLMSTPDGEVAVDALAIGDLVLTYDGRVAAVSWIGRQTVSTRFGDPLRVFPIRVKKGALGENVPCRDFLLSPDHAILINDVLIQAGALVNGTSIIRETNVPQTFTYYHIELDDHALILAENTPAETFIDNVDRLGFDNWREHEALYPEGKPIVEMPYLRAKAHRQVPRAIREQLAERGAALVGVATLAA